jgi:hypothetical protein
MHETPIVKFINCEARPLAVVLGTNEIASAIAVRLNYNGCRVILSHDQTTPVLRRKMAFHDALYEEAVEIDGVRGRRADSIVDIAEAFAQPQAVVAVTPLQLMDLIVMRRPDALVDARLQNCRITPNLRGVAAFSVGVGGEFQTSVNCDAAVSTQPLGAAVEEAPQAEAFVHAQREGVWLTPLDVGARVYRGVALGRHAGVRVFAPKDGVLRGIARDGCFVPRGARLLEIDPRGRTPNCAGTDEQGRRVANAVMSAIRHVEAQRERRSAFEPVLS